MPSSLTLPAIDHPTRREELLRVLERVPDPRDPRGKRFPLPSLLALAITATIAGARSFSAVGQWAADGAGDWLDAFGITGRAPEESTLRKLFARLDADALDRALGVWMWTRSQVVDGRRVIALDGKTVRGARTRPDGKAPHLIAALDHDTGVVVGQVAVDTKSNEISAARTLLGWLDLRDAVATLDAMNTQTDTARLITGGGDYVFTVKLNTPTLHAQLKKLPWKHVTAHRHTDTARGQRATPTIKVADVPDWVDFPGAAQVAQLRRTVTGKDKKKRTEVVYLITSASARDASPNTLAAWVRGHWGIENRLHYVRDVSYGEDLSQIRTGHAPRVMAACRNTAISLLRLAGWSNIVAAQRHHSWHADQAIKLALTS